MDGSLFCGGDRHRPTALRMIGNGLWMWRRRLNDQCTNGARALWRATHKVIAEITLPMSFC